MVLQLYLIFVLHNINFRIAISKEKNRDTLISIIGAIVGADNK